MGRSFILDEYLIYILTVIILDGILYLSKED